MAAPNIPILSLLIWLPIASGVMVFLTGNNNNVARARAFSLATCIVSLSISLWCYYLFDATSGSMQLVERIPWIATFNINYALGVDGIALPLIMLTNLTGLLVVISTKRSVQSRVVHYLSAVMILQGLMCGVFAALDAILFYFFWEAMLIPMFLIIGIWGGPRRIYATIKFFLYTFLGSVFMLVALLYLYSQTNSFVISDFYSVPLTMTAQVLIFAALLLAFAVKVPMWPVHTWLPDAHTEAPTGGSVILAAILLKMGGYGFIRFSLPIVPDASHVLAGMMIALSLVAVVYIGFVAIAQTDMKKLIAYSSIAHMGFVTLGFFIIFGIMGFSGRTSTATMSIEGAMVQMISHGFISAALFFCVGVLYDRMHSRAIKDYGGVVNTMPIYASLFMVFALANAGLPGTSGFVGEFLVVLSAFQAHLWIAIIAASVLILGPAYTLWMYKRVIFGPVANDKVAALQDVDNREYLVLAVLALMVLVFGIWPKPLLDMMHVTIEQLLPFILHSKL